MPVDVLNMLILNTLPHAMWRLDLVTLYDIIILPIIPVLLF